MTFLRAIEERHMVRRYKPDPIPPDLVIKLNHRIEQNNNDYDIDICLVVGNSDAFNPVIRLLLARGVRNYLVMSGEDSPDLDQRLGYCGADIMLYAQEQGLNSWWVGGTFSKRGAIQAACADKKVIGVIALGYGVTQGKPHTSKQPGDVAFYDGLNPNGSQIVFTLLYARRRRSTDGHSLYGEKERACRSFA